MPQQIDQSLVKSDLLKRSLNSAEEIAKYYGMPVEAAKKLLSEPGFLVDFITEEKNALRLRFYISGCDRLMKIIETDKPRTAIMAMKVLSSILGEKEGKPLVQIQNNQQNTYCYEEMLRQAHEL